MLAAHVFGLSHCRFKRPGVDYHDIVPFDLKGARTGTPVCGMSLGFMTKTASANMLGHGARDSREFLQNSWISRIRTRGGTAMRLCEFLTKRQTRAQRRGGIFDGQVRLRTSSGKSRMHALRDSLTKGRQRLQAGCQTSTFFAVQLGIHRRTSFEMPLILKPRQRSAPQNGSLWVNGGLSDDSSSKHLALVPQRCRRSKGCGRHRLGVRRNVHCKASARGLGGPSLLRAA